LCAGKIVFRDNLELVFCKSSPPWRACPAIAGGRGGFKCFDFLIFLYMKTTVRILTLKNEIEASLIDEILNEKGIPHIIRSLHDSAYDGMWQSETCWGFLDADEENKEDILNIYDEMSRPENIIDPI
jgi:hypothetical protein